MSQGLPSSQVLELRGIQKRFGRIEVLRGIDLSVGAGEVVGLVGDNGAGKSTLVRIISGYLRPTSGAILVHGEKKSFASPRDARHAGIETVYQDLAIVKDMSLWRNFFLGNEIVRRVFPFRVLRRQEMKTICQQHLRDLGLTSVRSVDEMARNLSGGERQTLAITRSVYFQSNVLVLDEPVAALSVRETRRVMDEIRRARGEGIGVIYIDHNMNHVLPVADRIAVVQHGRIATVIRPSETTAEELGDLVARAGADSDEESG
jgi:simple sugar transport system ATP-binding protein